MSAENDINKQAQEFLSAMAPKPVPPASRRKNAEQAATQPEKPESASAHMNPSDDNVSLTPEEEEFVRKFCSWEKRKGEDKRSHVAISQNIHHRLNRFCQMTGTTTLYGLMNNILSDFINGHEEIFQSILSKYANKKF